MMFRSHFALLLISCIIVAFHDLFRFFQPFYLDDDDLDYGLCFIDVVFESDVDIRW